MKKSLKKLLAMLMCAVTAFGFFACDDDDDTEPTKVVLNSVESIEDSVHINAKVSGDDAISYRGAFVSTKSITENDALTLQPYYADEAGNGEFTLSIGDLELGTEYYVRAFAKNKKGTTTLSSEQTVSTTPLNGTYVKVKDATATDGKVTLSIAAASSSKLIERGAYISEQAINTNKLTDLRTAEAKYDEAGNYTLTFSNLFRNTEYHVVAYAKDETGKITYSKEQIVKTLASGNAVLEITVEGGENSVSATVVSSDPISRINLKKKFDTPIKPTSCDTTAKDGVFTYTVKFEDVEPGEYFVTAENANAQVEKLVATGLFRNDFSESSIPQEEGTYYYRNGDIAGTIIVKKMPEHGDYVLQFNDQEGLFNFKGNYFFFLRNEIVEQSTRESSVQDKSSFLGKLSVDGDAPVFSGEGIVTYTKAQK